MLYYYYRDHNNNNNNMDSKIPLELYENVVETMNDDFMTCYSLVTTNKDIMNSITRDRMAMILFNRNIKYMLNSSTEYNSLEHLNKIGNFSFKNWTEANTTLLNIMAQYNFSIHSCNFSQETNKGHSVSDKLDQFCLIRFMKEWLPNNGIVSGENWGSLFWDADNIRYVCSSNNINIPEWFSSKYSTLLVQ